MAHGARRDHRGGPRHRDHRRRLRGHRFEVTPATVVAFLTILGFSLYDTVVVFDKVRDNQARIGTVRGDTFSTMVNRSLNQVLMRSINTSIVALLPVASLLFVGIAPAAAPQQVQRIIAAGNQIASKPYKFGGGHGKWIDTGYDCSGSVSFALHGAGLLDQERPDDRTHHGGTDGDPHCSHGRDRP